MSRTERKRLIEQLALANPHASLEKCEATADALILATGADTIGIGARKRAAPRKRAKKASKP